MVLTRQLIFNVRMNMYCKTCKYVRKPKELTKALYSICGMIEDLLFTI